MFAMRSAFVRPEQRQAIVVCNSKPISAGTYPRSRMVQDCEKEARFELQVTSFLNCQERNYTVVRTCAKVHDAAKQQPSI